MGYANLSLTEEQIVAIFYWDHHAVLIATQETQSVFLPTRISRIDVRQQVAVNKLLRLKSQFTSGLPFSKTKKKVSL